MRNQSKILINRLSKIVNDLLVNYFLLSCYKWFIKIACDLLIQFNLFKTVSKMPQYNIVTFQFGFHNSKLFIVNESADVF